MNFPDQNPNSETLLNIQYIHIKVSETSYKALIYNEKDLFKQLNLDKNTDKTIKNT